MLIVLLDEPGLFVYQTVADAVRAIEAIDAEDGIIRAAFDDSAVPYRVEWVRAPRRRKILFGLLESSSPGEYQLVPAGPADPAAFVELLATHPDYTDPPEAKGELSSLLSRFSAV